MTTKPKRRWALPLTGAVALVLGITVGAASADTTERVVTDTVEVEVPVEVPVEVATLPSECLDALTAADDLILTSATMIETMSHGFTLAGDAVEAAAAWDHATMDAIQVELEAILSEMNAANALITTSDYPASRDACRGHQ